MSIKIKDSNLMIMHSDRTMAITRANNLDLKGYIKVEYDAFVDSMAWKALKKKAEYSVERISKAKKMLEGFDFKLSECDILYCNVDNPDDRLPLVISFDEYAILIAPKIEVQ